MFARIVRDAWMRPAGGDRAARRQGALELAPEPPQQGVHAAALLLAERGPVRRRGSAPGAGRSSAISFSR